MVQENIFKLAKNILKLIDVKLKLTDIENIDSKLFVLFYEKILGNELENKIECPVTEKDDYQNIVAVIDKLSNKVLRVSLSHINPMDVLKGKRSAVTHLLEIFQGLAECMQQEMKGKNCRRNLREQIGNEKQKSRLIEGAENLRLKKRIDATDKQVDNLTRATEQVMEMSSARQRFLHEQIGKLIEKGPGWISECGDKKFQSDTLLEYVNDHRDRIKMTEAAIGQLSNRSANQPIGRSRSHRRHSSGGDVKELSKHGQEDELTCITANDAYVIRERDDEISCASNETYILESTTGRSDCRSCNIDLNEDLHMKDAWAQVNRDIIHKGYEKEFLDMLLDEGENLEMARKKNETNAELLRKFSEHEICSRPLSAFDELVKFEDEHSSEDCPKTSNRKPNQSYSEKLQQRNSKLKGYVRPVVKHLGGHYTRKYLEPETNSSISSRRNSHSVTSSRDRESVTQLLDSFPGLELSNETIRHLWNQAAIQASSIRHSHQHFISKLLPGEQKIEDARRRQKLLTLLLRKEALHQVRLQERKDERKAQITTLSIKEKQRQQSARAKRYVDEFSNGMRARMMTKQAREEQVFRSMFKEALKIQRDRINEMRRYAKDMKNEQLNCYQRDLESLETYYRDRFSMCADTLRKERKEINLQDKSQELALLKLKKEMRSKLENDIRVLQESLVKSQHEIYFRELDAKQVLSEIALK